MGCHLGRAKANEQQEFLTVNVGTPQCPHFMTVRNEYYTGSDKICAEYGINESSEQQKPNQVFYRNEYGSPGYIAPRKPATNPNHACYC